MSPASQSRFVAAREIIRRAASIVLVAAILGTVAVAGEKPGEALPLTNDIATLTMADLGHALLCMVVAAALGALLALRPRRQWRDTGARPRRQGRWPGRRA